MTSQLTIYSSNDASAPVMDGQSGSLLNVLDGVLVNGYGAKAAAGWSKTFAAATGSPVANSGSIGVYRSASPANGGLGFGLVVNDNGPNGTSTTKEGWATGFEQVTSIAGPVGAGSGQFPTPAQLLTTGHVVVRKSVAATAVHRAWICFADALTFYLFIASGDTDGAYHGLWFGDCFSLKGNSDAYRCLIFGGYSENGSYSLMDQVGGANIGANLPGLYLARTYGGGGTSVPAYLGAGGSALLSIGAATTGRGSNVGSMQVPNGPDNAFYTPPLWLVELTGIVLRGRLRGLYHSAHPLASWADGQVITGAGDFAGKTLQAVVRGVQGGMWFLETSATVETN